MSKNKLFVTLATGGLIIWGAVWGASSVLAQGGLTATIVFPPPGSEFLVNQAIQFQASASGGKEPYLYGWNFGDNTIGNGKLYTKKYGTAGDYKVVLTVEDDAGAKATAEVGVSIKSETPLAKPVISNLRVTDITSSSVIVRWTTDIVADSRVIYDLVSHPDINSQPPPNFGYAFSTITQDPSGVTEHAVTITGLSPKTTYYLRALSRGI